MVNMNKGIAGDSGLSALFKMSRSDVMRLPAQESLNGDDYIQKLHIAFKGFTASLTDTDGYMLHDAPLSKDEYLDGYNSSKSEAEIFTPTAFRQLSHFYANYALGLKLRSSPTFDFYTNRSDAVKKQDHDNDPTELLGNNLQSIYQSLHIFESKIQDEQALKQIHTFRNTLSELTNAYCDSTPELTFLRQANDTSAQWKPALAGPKI